MPSFLQSVVVCESRFLVLINKLKVLSRDFSQTIGILHVWDVEEGTRQPRLSLVSTRVEITSHGGVKMTPVPSIPIRVILTLDLLSEN